MSGRSALDEIERLTRQCESLAKEAADLESQLTAARDYHRRVDGENEELQRRLVRRQADLDEALATNAKLRAAIYGPALDAALDGPALRSLIADLTSSIDDIDPRLPYVVAQIEREDWERAKEAIK